ncbi:lysis protein [Pantoea sp. ICBG 1758]|uniref:phage holin n=1 Tax=Pantoea sp. ICBG 1758 TaxID=2071682 RepID=UPI000CE3FCD7|nr:phage holin [Pantoea sp. ICBG 1758]PPC64153.1 lysis protein [Pantoea sp. ICBG 1758]
MSINHMSKLASGAAYGAAGSAVANGVLTRLSPDEWSAVGVIAGIVLALMTFAINAYFKRKVSLAQIRALEQRGYIASDQLGEE